jgi:spore coat polysaccharide biosynthesis protein SpsF
MNPKKNIPVLAVIQARMASSRLPGKILMKIDGKPLIQHIVERAKKASNVDAIVLATSTNKSDDPVEEFCRRTGVNYFRGSEEDVLVRLIGAAEKFSPELIVRICGDQPLFDTSLLERLIDRHREAGADYSTSTGALPKGLNFEVINYAVLKKVEKEATTIADREHVTKFILDHPERFKIQQVGFGEQLARSDIVLTVDTKHDFDFVKRIYLALKKKGKHKATAGVAEEIIRLVDNHVVARKPFILLRADSSKEKGMGDVVSLMNIAELLKDKYELIFASKDYAEGVDFIKSKGYEVFSLAVNGTREEEIKQVKALCDKRKINYCIVELFPNDASYVKELSQFLKTLVIDFFGNIEIYSDILVCWDFDAKDLKYDFKNKETLKLLGPDYAPLNNDIMKSARKKNSAKIERVAISFGGSDPNDLSFALLDVISDLARQYDFTFILGPGFKKIGEFANKAEDKNIKFIQSPKNIHQLFAKSDLVISRGGLTSLELCALGVPFIGISKLEWEIIRLKKLASFGICRFIQANDQLKDSLLQALRRLSSLEVRNKMTKKGMKLVDGKGALRIANAIKTRWKAWQEP